MNTRCGPVAVRWTERRSRTATVLLHGAAGSWTTWRAAIEAAQAGGDVADLVVPDLPGWGESPADVAGLDAAALAAAVAETLRALGFERWHIVGHSLGGFVALELAAQEPAATESVVLVSATTFGGRGDRMRLPELLRRYAPLLGLLVVMRALARCGQAASRLAIALDRAHLLAALTAPLFGRPSPEAVADLARDLRPAAFVRAVACARRYPAAERWRRVRCPVLAVHGDHDLFSPTSDDAMLVRILPQLRSLTLPGTGHFAHVEHPTLLAGRCTRGSVDGMVHEVVIRSADAGSWDDIRTVFGTVGDPSGCWCQWFKLPRSAWDAGSRDEKARLLQDQLHHGSPGVIASLDGEPVGWAAVEPYSAYPALSRSPITRRRDGDPADPWAITCFVVRPDHRRRGIAGELLAGAVDHARGRGARVLEGYPVDPEARPSLTSAERYHGTVSLFRGAGFDVVRRPSATRAVMRRELSSTE